MTTKRLVSSSPGPPRPGWLLVPLFAAFLHTPFPPSSTSLLPLLQSTVILYRHHVALCCDVISRSLLTPFRKRKPDSEVLELHVSFQISTVYGHWYVHRTSKPPFMSKASAKHQYNPQQQECISQRRPSSSPCPRLDGARSDLHQSRPYEEVMSSRSHNICQHFPIHGLVTTTIRRAEEDQT